MKGTLWETINDEDVKYDRKEVEFLFAAKVTVAIEKTAAEEVMNDQQSSPQKKTKKETNFPRNLLH